MPRFFMHLVDGSDVLLDPDGVDLAAEAVARCALVQARDCMAGDVKDGRLDLTYSIEVRDAGGELVHTLPFARAIDIVSPARFADESGEREINRG
jgi:hypothetical protein